MLLGITSDSRRRKLLVESRRARGRWRRRDRRAALPLAFAHVALPQAKRAAVSTGRSLLRDGCTICSSSGRSMTAHLQRQPGVGQLGLRENRKTLPCGGFGPPGQRARDLAPSAAIPVDTSGDVTPRVGRVEAGKRGRGRAWCCILGLRGDQLRVLLLGPRLLAHARVELHSAVCNRQSLRRLTVGAEEATTPANARVSRTLEVHRSRHCLPVRPGTLCGANRQPQWIISV